MPWFAEGKCVYAGTPDAKGELVKCHETDAEAADHVKALYANVENAAEMKCPHCGADAPAGSEKCPACGKPMETEAEASPALDYMAAVAAIEATAEAQQASAPEVAAEIAGHVAELKRLGQIIAGGETAPSEAEMAASIIAPLVRLSVARSKSGRELEAVNSTIGHARIAVKAIGRIVKQRDSAADALAKIAEAAAKVPGPASAIEPVANAPEPGPPPPTEEAKPAGAIEDKGEHLFLRLAAGEIEDMLVVPLAGEDGVQAVYGQPEGADGDPVLVGYLFAKAKWDEEKVKGWASGATAKPAEAAAAKPAEAANGLRVLETREIDTTCAAELLMAPGRTARYEIVESESGARYAEGWIVIARPGWRKDKEGYYTEKATRGLAKLSEERPIGLDHPEHGKLPSASAIHGVIVKGSGHTHATKEAKCSVCGCASKGDMAEVAKARIFDPERVKYLENALAVGADHLLQFSFRGRLPAQRMRDAAGHEYDYFDSPAVLVRAVDQVYEGAIPGAEWLEHAASMKAQGGAKPMPELTPNAAFIREAQLAERLRFAADHVVVNGYRPETLTGLAAFIKEVANSVPPAETLDAKLSPEVLAAKAKDIDIANTPAPSPAARKPVEAGADTKDVLNAIVDRAVTIPTVTHLDSAIRYRSGRATGEVIAEMAQAQGLKVAVDEKLTKAFVCEVMCSLNRMSEMEARRPKIGRYIADPYERERVALDFRKAEVENAISASPSGPASVMGLPEKDVENALSMTTLARLTADRMKKRMRLQFKSIMESLGFNAPADLPVSVFDDENDTIAVRDITVSWPDTIPQIAQLANYVTLAAPADEEESLSPIIYGGIQEFAEELWKADALGALQLYIERMGITLDLIDYMSRFTPWVANSNMDDGSAIFATGGTRVNLRNAAYTFNDIVQALLLGIGRVDLSTGAGVNAMPIAWEPYATVSTRDNWVQIMGNWLLKERPDTSQRDGSVAQAVDQYRGMRHYCQSTWTVQGYSGRTVIFGNPKTGPTGRHIRYEGRDTAEMLFTDDRKGYPGLYSNLVVAKVRKGFRYRPVSHRNVLALFA